MENYFIKRWVGYNTLSVLGSFITLFYFPILATLLVVIGQAVMLSKKVGGRAFLWLLNPVVFGYSCLAYRYGVVWGVLSNLIALEIVFAAVIGRFIYFIWSGIVAVPAGLFIIISRFGLSLVNHWLAMGVLFLLMSSILWWLEAVYLSYIFQLKQE